MFAVVFVTKLTPVTLLWNLNVSLYYRTAIVSCFWSRQLLITSTATSHIVVGSMLSSSARICKQGNGAFLGKFNVWQNFYLQRPHRCLADEMSKYHSDDYVKFLRSIRPDNMSEYTKQMQRCKWSMCVSSSVCSRNSWIGLLILYFILLRLW